MIDPITIGLAVSGVKAAYALAQQAIEGIKAAAELGHEAQDVMTDLGSFFSAQGKVEAAVKEAQEAKVAGGAPAEDGRTDTEVALEAMMMARKLKQDEEFIKDYLTYGCNEAGLYAELCERRDAIANERANKEAAERAARTEKLLEAKRIELAKRKAKQARIDMAINALSIVIGTSACAALVYFIYWMFQQGK